MACEVHQPPVGPLDKYKRGLDKVETLSSSLPPLLPPVWRRQPGMKLAVAMKLASFVAPRRTGRRGGPICGCSSAACFDPPSGRCRRCHAPPLARLSGSSSPASAPPIPPSYFSASCPLMPQPIPLVPSGSALSSCWLISPPGGQIRWGGGVLCGLDPAVR